MHYRIAEKFGRGKYGEFGKSSMIYQTKTIQIIVLSINNLSSWSINSPNFFCQMLTEKSKNSPKFSPTRLSCYMIYFKLFHHNHLSATAYHIIIVYQSTIQVRIITKWQWLLSVQTAIIISFLPLMRTKQLLSLFQSKV